MKDIIIDEIIRTRRKTLQLTITREARLIIRAPLRLSEKRIYAFVEEKRGWILKKQAEALKRLEATPGPDYPDGSKLLFLGREYTLAYKSDTRHIALHEESIIIPEVYRENPRPFLIKWYQAQARRYIMAILPELSSQTGISYAGVRLSSARKRWGSCNAKNGLSFSWPLIMAHPRAVEYVVIHELCHVLHKNHSKDFWREVEAHMPDYKLRRKWLRDHQNILEIV